jgi:hypothetical protein
MFGCGAGRGLSTCLCCLVYASACLILGMLWRILCPFALPPMILNRRSDPVPGFLYYSRAAFPKDGLLFAYAITCPYRFLPGCTG